eukprot:COSAG03_NODE_16860_length_390_cov_1.219931_2_plen_46_part_01
MHTGERTHQAGWGNTQFVRCRAQLLSAVPYATQRVRAGQVIMMIMI